MSKSRRLIAKASNRAGLPAGYPALLAGIKQRIRAAQVRATMSANAELVSLYWDVGRAIARRQGREGWGTKVLARLAADLANDLSDVKGFSRRNLELMVQFYREYPQVRPIAQPLVAQLPPLVAARLPGQDSPRRSDALPIVSPRVPARSADLPPIAQPLVAQLPWAHNVLLMQKVKDLSARLWYMQQALAHGWSRNSLAFQIDARAHERHGKAITNFADHLPPLQSDLATQALKDPYIFDFLTLEEPFHERELEAGLLAHVQKFLLELGQGFAFVGRQYRIRVDGEDYSIDLLFYHLYLRCFFVIDLKTGAFKPEYAGKMNFYCNLVDDHLRHQTDQPTIGLVLCQDKNRLVAEYALKGINKAIGVSEYDLTRSLPTQLRSSLPSIKQIEAELSEPARKMRPLRRRKRSHRRR